MVTGLYRRFFRYFFVHAMLGERSGEKNDERITTTNSKANEFSEYRRASTYFVRLHFRKHKKKKRITCPDRPTTYNGI